MLIDGNVFTIGADPELFVEKDGRIVSAYGLIPGTKYEPFLVDKGAVQIDGMATEFNTNPALDEEEFLNNIRCVKASLAGMLPGYEFSRFSSHLFDDEVMATQPLQAILLGCEPDYNCYTMKTNPRPNQRSNMRTAGGHIHVGGIFDEEDGQHFKRCARLTSILDEKIGLYSLLWDGDDARRSMYGKAGAFRPKYYGVEYRSPSCAWTFNEGIIRFVFRQVENALKCFFIPDYKPHVDVQSIINGSLRDHPLLNSGDEVNYINLVMEVRNG